jgi:hypothetical protein
LIFFQGGSFGGVIYSILLNKILPREDWGFPWAVRCVHYLCVEECILTGDSLVAFINVVLLVIANLVMKPRRKSLHLFLFRYNQPIFGLIALLRNSEPVDMNQILKDGAYWTTILG